MLHKKKKNTIEVIALFSIILRKYPARRTKLFIIQSNNQNGNNIIIDPFAINLAL